MNIFTRLQQLQISLPPLSLPIVKFLHDHDLFKDYVLTETLNRFDCAKKSSYNSKLKFYEFEVWLCYIYSRSNINLLEECLIEWSKNGSGESNFNENKIKTDFADIKSENYTQITTNYQYLYNNFLPNSGILTAVFVTVTKTFEGLFYISLRCRLSDETRIRISSKRAPAQVFIIENQKLNLTLLPFAPKKKFYWSHKEKYSHLWKKEYEKITNEIREFFNNIFKSYIDSSSFYLTLINEQEEKSLTDNEKIDKLWDYGYTGPVFSREEFLLYPNFNLRKSNSYNILVRVNDFKILTDEKEAHSSAERFYEYFSPWVAYQSFFNLVKKIESNSDRLVYQLNTQNPNFEEILTLSDSHSEEKYLLSAVKLFNNSNGWNFFVNSDRKIFADDWNAYKYSEPSIHLGNLISKGGLTPIISTVWDIININDQKIEQKLKLHEIKTSYNLTRINTVLSIIAIVIAVLSIFYSRSK